MEGPPIRKGSLDGRIPFGLSATVVSMILVSIMRFPWYTTDRVWVPENGTPQLLQYVLYIVLAWNSYSTWWEPLSMLRKAVAYIRASTLLGLLELGSHQLCLLAMVILVSILVLNQLPPIGGELGVQIAIPIWTRLTVIRSMGPVYYPVIVKNQTNTIQSCDSTNFMPVSKSRYRRNDAWGPTWFTPYSMPNNIVEVHSLVIVFPSV